MARPGVGDFPLKTNVEVCPTPLSREPFRFIANGWRGDESKQGGSSRTSFFNGPVYLSTDFPRSPSFLHFGKDNSA